MSEVPSLPYLRVVNALQRAGFVVIRQRGSYIRLQKRTREGIVKVTVPAHRHIKKTTPAKLIKEIGPQRWGIQGTFMATGERV